MSTSTSLFSSESSSVVRAAEISFRSSSISSFSASSRMTGTMFSTGWRPLSSSSTTKPRAATAPSLVKTSPTSIEPFSSASLVSGPPESRRSTSANSMP